MIMMTSKLSIFPTEVEFFIPYTLISIQDQVKTNLLGLWQWWYGGEGAGDQAWHHQEKQEDQQACPVSRSDRLAEASKQTHGVIFLS